MHICDPHAMPCRRLVIGMHAWMFINCDESSLMTWLQCCHCLIKRKPSECVAVSLGRLLHLEPTESSCFVYDSRLAYTLLFLDCWIVSCFLFQIRMRTLHPSQVLCALSLISGVLHALTLRVTCLCGRERETTSCVLVIECGVYNVESF